MFDEFLAETIDKSVIEQWASNRAGQPQPNKETPMTQRAADRHIEIIPLRVGYHSADLIMRVAGNVQDVPIRLSPMFRGINFWIQENNQ